MFWVRFCALFNFFFGVLHLFFLYSWRQLELWKGLSPVAAATFDMFNIQIAILLSLVGCLYFFYPGAIRTTLFGRALNFGMLLFWGVRAIDDVVLYGVRHPGIELFSLGAVAHAVIGWSRRELEGRSNEV